MVAAKPGGAEAKTYRAIAAKVGERLQRDGGGGTAAVPSIVFE